MAPYFPSRCSNPAPAVSYNQSNQTVGVNYDASGNLTGNDNYLYDAEGRLCAVKYQVLTGGSMTMMGYIYDAGGRRVAKGAISQWSCDMDHNGFDEKADYVLGPNGEQMAELDGQGNWVHTNVYANGELIATYTPSNLSFHLNDWLGTRRMDTDPFGNPGPSYQSKPFGEPLDVAQNISSPEHFFTGKERDSESGLDYFGARYYGSSMGRFMSPDWNSEPEAIPYADLRNPQSLNLYAYVNNNPLRMADPDGHDGKEDEDDEGDPQATITAPAPTAPSPVGVEPEIPGGGVLGLLPLIYYDLKGIGEIINPSVHAGEDTRGKVDNPRTTPPDPQGAHRKDARPSTKGKHQKGQGRKKKDKGGEKGDQRRQQNGMFPRKPPPGHKGPWPPRDFNEFVPVPVPPPDKPKKDTHGDG